MSVNVDLSHYLIKSPHNSQFPIKSTLLKSGWSLDFSDITYDLWHALFCLRAIHILRFLYILQFLHILHSWYQSFLQFSISDPSNGKHYHRSTTLQLSNDLLITPKSLSHGNVVMSLHILLDRILLSVD